MGLRPDLLWRLLNLTRRRGFSRCFGSNLFRHENVPALTSCATRNRLPAFPGFRKLSRPHLFIEKAGWWSCLHAERGGPGSGKLHRYHGNNSMGAHYGFLIPAAGRFNTSGKLKSGSAYSPAISVALSFSCRCCIAGAGAILTSYQSVG